MAEPIDWLADSPPFNPRFADRYHSENGLAQARAVFLAGCRLPSAWQGQSQWTVLETGFGLGLNFLATWQAWAADARRPQLLHYHAIEAFPASAADVLRSAQLYPELLPYAQALQQALWGLLPGFHRLVFEGGRVLLTLCIGDVKAMLEQSFFQADSVYLDGFSPACNPDMWDVHTLKAVARCCRRGTHLATWTAAGAVRRTLSACGFVVQRVPGVAPKRHNLQAEFQPAWQIKTGRAAAPVPYDARPTAGHCVVVGSGLAGAAVAASLARRGWQVQVLDAGAVPAAGASGLPAGLFAPHVSRDDSLLSRLSRSGVRACVQQAEQLLQIGSDWALSGVLERSISHARQQPDAYLPGQTWADAAADWSQAASPAQRQACALPADEAAWWHVCAGWAQPAKLVHAWLQQPGVTWRGNSAVQRVGWQADAEHWQVLDAQGHSLAQADLVVLAAGPASAALLAASGPPPVVLRPMRGQVTWGWHAAASEPLAGLKNGSAFPAFPVNGYGNFIPAVPLTGPKGLAPAWITGASFERNNPLPQYRPEDTAYNLERLHTLLPTAAAALQADFATEQVQSWSGVRAVTPSHLPLVGPVPAQAPGLWLCTGLGARGLSLAALCAELLAARLHGEPLPLERQLADALLPDFHVRRRTHR